MVRETGSEAAIGGPDGRDGAGPIILVRHGRPSLARRGHLTPEEWTRWWAAYGEAGLADGECPPASLRAAVAPAVHRLASPLPRARETAERLFDADTIEADPVFMEAPLPAPQWPAFVRLSPGLWGAVSRTLWLLGYDGGGESHKVSKIRARLAADRLITAARDGPVVLCAHGWINRMIRGDLVRKGWICDRDGGDNYWSWRRLVRP